VKLAILTLLLCGAGFGQPLAGAGSEHCVAEIDVFGAGRMIEKVTYLQFR
jgi:hypothetical protein